MNRRFEISQSPIPGVKVLTRHPIRDDRGYLERLYCVEELVEVFGERKIAQINHTLTARKGTVRGLHFQRMPKSEMKLVSCVKGEIFDIAVDLRKDSPTYLKWHAETLSENNFMSMVIPEGVAHGFQALTENCELIYLHTEKYDPKLEGGIHPVDPKININWPLNITFLSDRDNSHPRVNKSFNGF